MQTQPQDDKADEIDLTNQQKKSIFAKGKKDERNKYNKQMKDESNNFQYKI